MLAARWRLLDSGAADGATNMATDHALLDRAATSNEAVLRIYAWSRPTLSFGLHEKARIGQPALSTHGVDVVRRPTGGRALLHHREVTYSVTAPLPAAATPVGLGESYRVINTILRDALARLGVQADEAPRRGRASSPDGAPCFAEPNVGELVVNGRKLVGSAQRRDERALLQHGSILLGDDQAMIAVLRGDDAPLAPSVPIVPSAATLNDALGREVVYSEVRDALVDALVNALVAALGAVPGAAAAAPISLLSPDTLAPAVATHLVQYRSSEWTWRR